MNLVGLWLATAHPYASVLLGAAIAAPLGVLAGVLLERRWWLSRVHAGVVR